MNLADLTLAEASALLREGKASSVELTEACLARIEQVDPTLRAFLTVTTDLARAQAREADRRLAEWRKNPFNAERFHPLIGIPLAVKDVLCLQGTRTTS